ncbi:holin [Ileibacterium valens]|nr:holin [Ileibacterium valens]
MKGDVTMSNKTKIWIKAAAVRAIKTVAQTAVGVIGASALITEVDFLVVLSASALAGLVSLLTSVAGLPEVENA